MVRMNRAILVLFLVLALLVTGVLTGCGDSAKGTAEWHVEQGIKLHEQGDYAAAVIEYDEAIRIDPEYARAYYDRGTALIELGEYRLAIEDFSVTIRLDPEDAWAYGNRGDCYLELGEAERAI